jgi:hypothetical protein
VSGMRVYKRSFISCSCWPYEEKSQFEKGGE